MKLVFALCAATAVGLSAQTLTTLYSFCAQSGCADGGYPFAGLMQATDGNFYGTTFGAGAYGFGTVFKITASGTLTTLHSFDGADGQNPSAGVVQATDGNFYGTTYAGGANGYGTVFKITPSGTLTTLYSFCTQSGCTDGANPYFGALVQSSDGDLYGTTEYGGLYGISPGAGTVFKITPSGALTTLYNFCSQSGCTDGENPYAGLVQAADGYFYGTTALGGTYPTSCQSHSCGTVYQISASGILTTLASFDNTNGAYPFAGLVVGRDGNFYGTSGGGAQTGGGNVFSVTPDGTLAALYNFCTEGTFPTNCADGEIAYGGLVQATDGNFYGTTYEGGANSTCVNGCGTIFKITPGGVLTTLHNFDLTDGEYLFAGLVQATDGKFYGTTELGGASNGGTVFSLSVGLSPFVETRPNLGTVGAAVTILGTDLTGATSVSFNGTAAVFKVVSNSEITTTVPAGASSGKVQVVIPGATLSSNVAFLVRPRGPNATLSTASLSFATQLVGTSSAAQPVTVTNFGTMALDITSVTASGDFAADNGCGSGLSVLGSCTINVTFKPTQTGARSGTLSIADNAPGSPQSVALSGTGTLVELSPSNLSFGVACTKPHVDFECGEQTQKATLTNSGSTTLDISGMTISGSGFSRTDGCGSSLLAGASCSISVTFHPGTPGTFKGSLSVRDSGGGSPQTVTLSGSASCEGTGCCPPPICRP